MAAQRLGYGEQALTDVGTLLSRIHVLAVQANSGAMDDASLNTIATELRERASELLQIANRKDGNGEYLYSGYATGTQPFSGGGAGVSYAGDQGVRQLALSATQQIADGFNGQHVFMDIPEGNGRFAVSAGVRAGTGVVGVTQVADLPAWQSAAAAAAAVPQPHSYTLRFFDSDLDGTAESWEALDAGGTQVAAGAYVADGAISFDGIQINVGGQPAPGDTFAITPAGTESLFKTVDDLILALQSGAATPQARAQLGTDLNKALSQLQVAMDHVVNVRAETGARLSALDAAATHRDDLDYELAESLGALRDLDYAEAVSRLNQQMAGLQAAQSAYTRIGQMSLFDFL
jgi:flagellar hook-associated protein 3 FlgL